MGPLCPRVGELWRKKYMKEKVIKKIGYTFVLLSFPYPRGFIKKGSPTPCGGVVGTFFFRYWLKSVQRLVIISVQRLRFQNTPNSCFWILHAWFLKFLKLSILDEDFKERWGKGILEVIRYFNFLERKKMYLEILWVLEGFPLIVRKNICICNSMIILK